MHNQNGEGPTLCALGRSWEERGGLPVPLPSLDLSGAFGAEAGGQTPGEGSQQGHRDRDANIPRRLSQKESVMRAREAGRGSRPIEMTIMEIMTVLDPKENRKRQVAFARVSVLFSLLYMMLLGASSGGTVLPTLA